MLFAMTRCSVFIATSLDGYIARADGGIDWLAMVARVGEDYGYAKFIANVDVLLIGRSTFETAVGFPEWPYAGKRVVVATHRPQPSIHGEVYATGEPKQLLADIGPAPGLRRRRLADHAVPRRRSDRRPAHRDPADRARQRRPAVPRR
jgi:dihydrofolate reductase